MRKSFVLGLHGEWSEFADERIGLWSEGRLLYMTAYCGGVLPPTCRCESYFRS
jgi:hypothetical protein